MIFRITSKMTFRMTVGSVFKMTLSMRIRRRGKGQVVIKEVYEGHFKGDIKRDFNGLFKGWRV